jgi:ankyrin repeat protein
LPILNNNGAEARSKFPRRRLTSILSAGSDQILGLLRPREFNINESVVIQATYPLFLAAPSGDLKTTKHLIESGADLNMEAWKNDWPLVLIAIGGSNISGVGRLLEAEEDVNA